MTTQFPPTNLESFFFTIVIQTVNLYSLSKTYLHNTLVFLSRKLIKTKSSQLVKAIEGSQGFAGVD